jgi:hypothetical protein
MESTDSTSSPSDTMANTSAQPGLNASSLFSYLKSTADAAQKKVAPALKELSKAEDAADAYLNKWGASFSQMIKDAVAIVPPEESGSLSTREGNVLFDGGKEKGHKYGLLSLLPLITVLEVAATGYSKHYMEIRTHLSKIHPKLLLPHGKRRSRQRSIPMKLRPYSTGSPHFGQQWMVWSRK